VNRILENSDKITCFYYYLPVAYLNMQ